MKEEQKNNLKTNQIVILKNEYGQVNVHNSIFISIVKKVLSTSENIKSSESLFEKIKQKIKVTINNDLVTIDIPIIIIYGENIIKISKKIQKNIKEEIMLLLDFKKVIVNIFIEDIFLQK